MEVIILEFISINLLSVLTAKFENFVLQQDNTMHKLLKSAIWPLYTWYK